VLLIIELLYFVFNLDGLFLNELLFKSWLSILTVLFNLFCLSGKFILFSFSYLSFDLCLWLKVSFNWSDLIIKESLLLVPKLLLDLFLFWVFSNGLLSWVGLFSEFLAYVKEDAVESVSFSLDFNFLIKKLVSSAYCVIWVIFSKFSVNLLSLSLLSVNLVST